MKRNANTGKERARTLRAVESPSVVDLAWAAGFLEGEVSISQNSGCAYVAAEQIEWEPIVRLIRMFGGQVYPIDRQRNQRSYIEVPRVRWAVYGARARGVLFTLYPWFSSKRRAKIREVTR